MKKTISSLALALAATSAAAQVSAQSQSPRCVVDSSTSVPAASVQPIPGGFFIKATASAISATDPRVEVSQDQDFYIGMGSSNDLICLFVPASLFHDAIAATEVWERL